jgi:L-rhamnonate dehydratase
MKIASVRCRAYTGTMDYPEEFWEERLIRPVDIYPPFDTDNPPPLARQGEHSYRMRSVFVHIETDGGVTGTGGPITDEQALIIMRTLGPLLIGRDPLATEQLWDILYRYSVHGRKGTEMLAISAVDCALWDLKGRYFGVPVHVLLGGPVRDEIPAYASALGYSLELDRVRETVAHIVAAGYRATKWFPRSGPLDGREGIAKVVALVEAIRETAGPDVDVMIDAWMSWDVPYTLQMARRLEEYAPRWIEEPVLPDKHEAYAEITRRIGNTIAVAGGEHEYTRWGLQRLMAIGAAHVYQPDTYWAGGISEMVKIAAIATVYDVQLIPHGHSVSANANLSFALSPTLVPLLEYLVKWNVVHQWFLKHPVQPVHGVITPPTEPGLGMDLDDEKVEQRVDLS